MDYELTRLNWRSFEQLIQAIGIEVFGPGLLIFGDGSDGGREATLEGNMAPFPSEKEPWDGRLVVQAKFRQELTSKRTDTKWVLDNLKSELDETFAPDSTRTRPTHYILATNVALSSVAESGGKAKIDALVANYPLQGFRLWDYDQLRAYLDVMGEVRRAFAAFITPGDVLAELMRYLDGKVPDFDRLIAGFLEKELIADQYANLEQAGRVAEEQIPISRVFVDLPILSGKEDDGPDDGANEVSEAEVDFIASALEIASERLDPTSQASGGPGNPMAAGPQRGRLVLIGGPGQGKTTAGQFLCQLFRTSLLKSRPPTSLAPETRTAIALMESQCEEEGLPIPSVRRFPVRVALTDLSDRLALESGPSSLLEAMAETISERSGRPLEPEVFRDWLGKYPWLLVLDGLDEVPASGNRDAVMKAIGDFWVDAANAESDVLVVATTRPQGYNDDFSPALYEHLTLAPLSPDRARCYGLRLAQARHGGDPVRQQRIVNRLDRASREKSTAKLMSSPLQVTIMATLVDRGPPPKQRWELFSEYYKVIYRRELEREIEAADVLRRHRPDIDAIHQRVALILQVESEHAAHAEARMGSERFAAVVRSRLEEEGHQGPALDALAEEIITAAANRLVFLVGLEADEVGFEIRSLQEFMAAEALMRGGDHLVAERLRAIAGVTSWRNVFLFAAGRCFAEQQHLRDTVTTICRQLNDPAVDPLAPIAWPGAALAIDLLWDGFTQDQPAYSRLLVKEALGLTGRAAASIDLVIAYEDRFRDLYEEELRHGLGDGLRREGSVSLLLHLSEEELAWADRMLDEQIPATTAGLEEALLVGEDSRFGWLVDRIQAQSGELSLSALSRHSAALASLLKAAPQTPALEIAEAFEESWLYGHDRGVRLALEPGVEGFKLRVLWLQAPLVEEMEKTILRSSPETLPGAWTGAKAALDFATDPTAAALAEQLKTVAERVPAEEWHTVERISSWPMEMALLAAQRDPERLRALAELAGKGQLGDRPEWEAAEERWHEDGVSLGDLDYVPEVDAPYDRQIGSRGFPVDDAAGLSRTFGRGAVVAKGLGSWLRGDVRNETRELLIRWLGFVLEGEAALESAVPAQDFCEYLSDPRGRHGGFFSYQLALALQWGDPLSEPEAAALDNIGLAITHPGEGKRQEPNHFLPIPPLPPGLVQCWNRDEHSDGLLRIIAIGLPAEAGLQLAEDAEIAANNPGAIGLLALKQGGEVGVRSAVEQMASVWEAEPVWLSEAVEAIEERADSALAERALSEIWRALRALPRDSSDTRELKRDLERLGAELVDRRATSLDRDAVWSELGLFARSPAADARGREAESAPAN